MHVPVKMKMWYHSEHSSFYQQGAVSKHVAILVVKLEVEGGGHTAMNSNSVKQYFIEHINDKVTVVWPLQNVNVNVRSLPMICARVLQRSSDVCTQMIYILGGFCYLWSEVKTCCFLIHSINDYACVLVRIRPGFGAVVMIDFSLFSVQVEIQITQHVIDTNYNAWQLTNSLNIVFSIMSCVHACWKLNSLDHFQVFLLSLLYIWISSWSHSFQKSIFTHVSHLLNLSSCNKKPVPEVNAFY